MIKKLLLVLGVVVAAALATAFVLQRGNATLLHVNQVVADPAAFSGFVEVVGIMAATSQQDPTLFGIMDLKELACTTPNCNKRLLSVAWTGAQPVLGDEVRITGRFVSRGKYHVLAAEAVKVIRHHQLGG